MADNTDVVVIGGGYAGVLAANRLTQRGDVAVTLVNPRPVFVERIRLHQLAAGTHRAVTDYRDVLAPGVRLVVDAVTRVDAAERSVALAEGGSLGYDHLVYAVGSGGAEPPVPGAAEFSHPVSTLEEAQRLADALTAAPAGAAVTVVGAGPTGIEAAAELAEQGRKVTLVCGGILGPYLHPRGRRSVAGRLAKLGVRVLDGPDSTVAEVTRETVRFADGRDLRSDVTVWTAGFGVPDLAARSGLSTDALGRLLTDETLTSVDDPRIVAAGDAAAPSDLPFRMSCQSATRLGAHAADTVLRRIAGEEPEPVNLGFFGQCISLGRGAGIFQFANRDDTAKGLHIAGRLGARVKEFVCLSTLKHLAHEAEKPGSLTWVADDTRRELLKAGRPAAPTAR
ncbi:NAD(P)/FAD-dependent oxidoreductase [Streptomonospora nanhaiensis]|uniref:NADH dehydrogenase FAD-containing subunit n=1 Tax=Streptomonospora nanhaiensis TaxID=1323731 RepID=A0A853BXB4_9ACTN|nr:FAD-dependent oxidoreductase [Streptomonospora nanhaiensis]MBV2364524.1 FAD-dependent oxidoreductase [Streptomonospora nanhaiensis]MBX9388058.1 FAD-dependent oxidoreductase [Streptomonospora nanhaiensis]NYI99131.1 NADH dehydrogenase FAD-containing subunit [Streptomonospora nanhaiensis]